MNNANRQLRGVSDTKLAVHALSSQPAWLWSLDGTKVLWANPVGARAFGARHAADLFARDFGPADAHRRQIAQLALRLPASGAVRLERLRGFGAAFGGLMTCACSRVDFADGGAGLLVVAIDPLAGRSMPLVERLQNLVDGIETPIAAFARDGLFVGASEAARALLGFRNLTDAGLDQARDHALKDGRAETPIGFGRMVLQRVGSGADIGLVALIAPGAVHPAPSEAEHPIATAPAHPAPPAPEVAEAEPEVIEVDPAFVDALSSAPAEANPVPAPLESEPPVAHEEAMATAPPEPPETAEPAIAPPAIEAPVALTAPILLPKRTTPLRFVWQLGVDETFSIHSDEFKQLIGPTMSAATSGRRWTEISTEFALDPDHRFAQALATRQTWSGVTLLWPVDDGGRLAVEMSGLPLQDGKGGSGGYRGFGICRDLDAINQLIARQHRPRDEPPPQPISADITEAGPVDDVVNEL